MALNAYAEKPPDTIYLIPIRFDDCTPPDLQIPELGVSLRNIQWLDLSTENDFRRLIFAIRKGAGLPTSDENPEGIDIFRGPDHVSNWPYKKVCPTCSGTMTLNHDTTEYGCLNGEYWEYGP